MDDLFDNHRNDFWFSAVDWSKMLHLATLYGYDPTLLEPGESTSPRELADLMAAVEESLDDIPNHNATGGKHAAAMSPFEWFSGPRKERLREFVRFCRESQIIEEQS